MLAREVVGQVARDRDAVVGDLRPVGEDDDRAGDVAVGRRDAVGRHRSSRRPRLPFADRDDRGVVAAREERLDVRLRDRCPAWTRTVAGKM